MFQIKSQKYILHLMCILSINLIYQISVSKCELSSHNIRSEAIGIKSYENFENAKLLRTKKDVANDETTAPTSDIIEKTTNLEDLINETNNSTTDPTSDQSSLTINETELTTPLNDSFVSIDETPDNTNGTDLEESPITDVYSESKPPITTTAYTIDNANITTEMPYTETPTTLTHTSNQSPIFSTTQSMTVNPIKNNDKFGMGLNEEHSQCLFESKINCQKLEIKCFGSGEIDCGSRKKRSLNYSDNYEANSDSEVYKLSLEKISQSETIRNTECVLTPHENQYFSCKPQPMIDECSGKSICKPTEKSSELNGPMELWKVGLIAALTAIGGTIFIIVVVVAYISYNKLKVRPELPMNGYHNNPQNVTRV